ncbi:hypothetical protein EBU95_07560 [bacterium]|nr:hypothetical protein [bacterium]
MIRQKLKSIIFNGVEGKAYGGNIYSFKIENNGIESPAKFIISVAYPPNEAKLITLGTRANIETEFFTFRGASSLFSCTLEKNPEYDSLHLTYYDASYILDKIYVGINYRHGTCETTSCFGTVTLLGGEVTNIAQEKECLNCQNNIEKFSTPVSAIPCDNKDAGYTIGDFITAFNGYINNLGILGRIGNDTLSYTGTLREVLSNLCSDAGASFICNYLTGEVDVIDASMGIEINDEDTASNNNIKKITVEESLEGTYAHFKSSFKITPTSIFSQQREKYKQIILTPQSTVLTEDVILGAVSQKSPERRDAYCRAVGYYDRIGIYGGLFSPDPEGGIYQNTINRLADCMQDSSLLDLVDQGFTYWQLSNYSDDLKNYYMERESRALSEYGTLYRSNVIPRIVDERTCISNKFRSVTTNEYYPDIDPDGYWRKSLSAQDLFPNENADLNGYYTPVIVPLVGELLEKYSLCVRSGLIGLRDFTNAAFIGWKFARTNIRPNIGGCKHPDEEEKKPIQEEDKTYCQLPCEESAKDPCEILNNECSIGPAGIFQGSDTSDTTCIDGIALPTAARFWGWSKETQDISKTREGSLEVGERFPNSIGGEYQSIRYTLQDLSNGDNDSGSIPAGVFGKSITKNYELIGEFVPIMHPSLRSWSVSIDGNGVMTNVSYQNRPPTPSKQDTTVSKVAIRKISLRS